MHNIKEEKTSVSTETFAALENLTLVSFDLPDTTRNPRPGEENGRGTTCVSAFTVITAVHMLSGFL